MNKPLRRYLVEVPDTPENRKWVDWVSKGPPYYGARAATEEILNRYIEGVTVRELEPFDQARELLKRWRELHPSLTSQVGTETDVFLGEPGEEKRDGRST